MDKIFAILAILIIAQTVYGANVPKYDIEEVCKETASGSNMIELHCRKMEEACLKRLQQMEIPPEIMDVCTETASMGTGGSYMLLEQCVKMELRAKKALGK